MNTIVRFHWKNGVELDWLVAKIKNHFVSPEYRLMDVPVAYHFGLGYRVPGGVLYCKVRFPLIGLKLNLENLQKLSWQCVKEGKGEAHDLNFNIHRGETDGEYMDCVKNGRIIKLVLSFEPDLNPLRLREGDVHLEKLGFAIERYFFIRFMYEYLECDSVDGNSDSFEEWYPLDPPGPTFEHTLFRFARTGRQIFLQPLEERRAMRPDEEKTFRRIVDEPS